ncbi:MAG: molybdenum cofactor guanylyltransferase [Candidatus Tectomicrobia bacterium]|uniref:Probable molybdenum cofactor guanylyltransferase n=1 Tax=Tectimicrobiota bacterium TaxID=2528274 RepID=A0A932FW24_UNCTE|nr:molybdenum cofactor guanylyltransferase [Candidatus Tectomicrobia bacterium]
MKEASCHRFTGVILAGGQSRRMRGESKAFLRLGGGPIIETVVAVLSSIFPEVLIVTRSPQDYQGMGCRVILDLPGAPGALTGLFSGLNEALTRYSFFVACDMPFLRPELIRYMVSLLEEGPEAGWDVLVPRMEEGYQPLHAFYAKGCLPAIVRQLRTGNQRIFDFFPQVKTREISREELTRFDPDLRSFFNINTPADLEVARRLYQGCR